MTITEIFVLITLILTLYIIWIKIIHKRKYAQLKNQLLEYSNNVQQKLLGDISRDIHDNVGQLLATAKMSLNILIRENLTEHNYALINLAKKDIEHARIELQILTRDVNEQIINGGLQISIENLVEKINLIGHPKVFYDVQGAMRKIPPHKEITVFRMLQEIVKNVLAHSNADTMEILIIYNPSYFLLLIKDNGIGFDLPNNIDKAKTKSVSGLVNLYYRAHLIDASLNIKSEKNKGTDISIKLPL